MTASPVENSNEPELPLPAVPELKETFPLTPEEMLLSKLGNASAVAKLNLPLDATLFVALI